ncbi:unnamed protein product [Bursaphelenchus okinawaensis]|uniref:Acyl-coenzyme A oxidase n=1 Tax=Bursaphelenchus okinawaensis TaxID=465554 RepID=A0A811LVZ9_9BILA|nr:unnamed protein product [Bursaphelenchus okinawaensis]CAG9128590.1 unnamed protein product [Bursaphelenchus okinawaensis]
MKLLILCIFTFLCTFTAAQPVSQDPDEIEKDIFLMLDKYGLITVRESATACPFIVAPASECPRPTVLHYYTCCGHLNAQCCENVQGYVVLASVIFIVSSLMPNRLLHPDHNPDLTSERQNCQFDTDELAARFHGGIDKIRRRHEILKIVESIPELRDSTQDTSFLDRMGKVENGTRNAIRLVKHIEDIIESPLAREEIAFLNNLIIGRDGFPFVIHYVMVVPMLMNNADDEQMEWWFSKALNREFVSTYAQTELGHGTNLKKLETTAVYDEKTEEFVLNTPTITATKWWPGNLGRSTNMVMIMALLYTNGKCYGAHPFMLQIRDFDTHKVLPGIEVGDIGPKYGMNANDNGYMRLNNVRISRRNMLMKNAKVEKDGTYIAPKHSKLAYTGMMFVRAVMIKDQANQLSMAATIATRYSCVRRQGEIVEGQGEVKVLDYKTQQYRVLPHIARSICFMFAGDHSIKLYERLVKDLSKGDTSLMADLHALGSGLKAVVSFQTSLGIEQCRMACGGHGYSEAGGFLRIYGIATGGCTYEGENMVMLLQLARYIVKLVPKIRSNDPDYKPSPLTAYYFQGAVKNKISEYNAENPRELNWTYFQDGFEYVSRQLAFYAYVKYEKLREAGMRPELAWNEVAVYLMKASRAHTRTFLARNFIERVHEEHDPTIKPILSDILHLYLLYEVLDCRADLLETGYMSHTQLHSVREEMDLVLTSIRKNAVNIVDSFDLADRELVSVLGRADGHVYENLYKWAQKSSINEHEVLPFHHETLGKMMRDAREKSKL